MFKGIKPYIGKIFTNNLIHAINKDFVILFLGSSHLRIWQYKNLSIFPVSIFRAWNRQYEITPWKFKDDNLKIGDEVAILNENNNHKVCSGIYLCRSNQMITKIIYTNTTLNPISPAYWISANYHQISWGVIKYPGENI
jgi:hypothetical protein